MFGSSSRVLSRQVLSCRVPVVSRRVRSRHLFPLLLSPFIPLYNMI